MLGFTGRIHHNSTDKDTSIVVHGRKPGGYAPGAEANAPGAESQDAAPQVVGDQNLHIPTVRADPGLS